VISEGDGFRMQPGILSKKIVDLESWRLLADRTRKEPLLRDPRVTKRSKGKNCIREKGIHPATVVLLLLLAVWFGWMGVSRIVKQETTLWFHVLYILLSALLVFAILRGSLWGKVLFFLPTQRILLVTWGFRLWPGTIELPADGLKARLMLSHETPGFSPVKDPLGRLWLVLNHKDEPGRVLRIAQGEDYAEMARVFLEMEEFLSGVPFPEGQDPFERMYDRVPLSDGRVFRMARTPIAPDGTSFQLHRLRFPSPDKAVFTRVIRAGTWFAVLLFVIVVVVGLWLSAAFGKYDMVFFEVVVGGFLAQQIIGVAAKREELAQYTVADRAAGIVTMHPKDKRARSLPKPPIIPFKEIVAVQICVKTHVGKDKPFYEINLILVGEQDRRVNITSHGREKQLREDAARFAEFLGKPLLDHAGVSSYATAYQEPQRVLRRAHTQD